MIREVHVYGKSVKIGTSVDESENKAQHLGLGKKLIQRATEISAEKEFERLQVISAIGTREYYRKLGFADGELYQFKLLNC